MLGPLSDGVCDRGKRSLGFARPSAQGVFLTRLFTRPPFLFTEARSRMNLTEKLLPVALLGAEWVLWGLIILSVISVTVMIERLWYFRSTAFDFESLRREL